MNFLNPAAFLFLFSLGAIFLLYILKKRRKEVVISSTLLWERFLSETQANSPFQKLRKHILMFIQMILALLLVLALARPFSEGDQKIYGLNVILIDASASMLSTDTSPSRFEKAKEMAKQLVESMESGSRSILIRMGANTEISQSATSQKSQLMRAIDAIKPGEGAAATTEALQLAQSLVKNPTATVDTEEGISLIPGARIHIFSDGGIENLDQLSTSNLPITFYPVGESGNNVAITSTDARPSALKPNEQTIFVEMHNYSTNNVLGVISLSFENDEIENRPIEIQAQSKFQSIFTVDQNKNGKYLVELSCDDDLSVDNKAWIVSHLPTPARIHLVSRGNFFLEKALLGIQNVEFSKSQDFSKLQDSENQFDVVVVDRIEPPIDYPAINTLWIDCQPDGWVQTKSYTEAPIITSAQLGHPLLRFVSLNQMLIARSQKMAMPHWASSIIQTTETPLLFEGELSGTKHVWLGFDTLESNWPRQVSFPIFVNNAISWLNSYAGNKAKLNKLTGEHVEFRTTENISSALVRDPDGKTHTIPVDEDSKQILYSSTEKSGIYQFEYGTNNVEVAVNAIHFLESQTEPAQALELGEVTSIKGSTISKAQVELWPWIIAVCLAGICFEWWYFHKRTA